MEGALHSLIWASQRGVSFQGEASPIDGKGKGKAIPESVPMPEPNIFETQFCGDVSGAHDQELRDLEYAIKLSLQDRDASDVKEAHAFKAS